MNSAPAEPSPVYLTPERINRLIWWFIGVGALVRLLRYALRFPLWEDEAFLAYNLFERNFKELLRPLDYIQVAPIGYLWLQRAVIDIFGFTELTLRAASILAALASLLIFRRVAALTLPPLAQLAAVALFAVSYPMIRYAAEAKQYGLDLFLGLSMVWFFLEMLLRPERKRWTGALLLIAAFGPFISHPLVFIGGGVGAAWVWSWWTGRLRNLLALFLFAAALGASFLTHYWFARQALGPANDALMQQFWGPNFPPLTEPLRFPLWLLKTLTGDLLAFPIGAGNGGSTLTFILVLGGVLLWIAQRRAAWLLLALVPLALHFAAAAVHKFPMGGHVKFSMYWAPLGVLLMGAALATIWQWLDRRPARPLWTIAGLALFVLIAAGSAARDLYRPAKNVSDQRARDFARWLWNDLPLESVVTSLYLDQKKTFTPELLERLNWSATFFCNARIYSPRLQKRLPPDLGKVSADHPLRCISYLPDGFKVDDAAQASFLRDMDRDYQLISRDRYPVPRYKQDGRTIVCVDHIDMFVFVPRPRADR